MEYQLLMRTAICAGELLLKSGAETYRAEDTMNHILKTSGCEYIEVHATITGIMATLYDNTMNQPVTMICKKPMMHYRKLERIYINREQRVFRP